MITATINEKESLPADDYRRTLPRLDREHWENNKQLVNEFAEVAKDQGCTAAQLALAWVLAQGEDIIPIPGTKKRKYLDENAAAVAGRKAGEVFGLTVCAENIEDDPNNTTRFLVIGAQEVAPSGKDKTSLVMSARNLPGAIHGLLAPLADNGVSMSRLESRPSRAGLWEYVFFVDIEGHQQDTKVAKALQELREKAAFLKVLGSYPAL